MEPEDPGWWYTVNEPVKFRECRLCIKRRGDDLDEETWVIHSKECKDCSEILQEPTKKGGKRTSGKGKQPITKRTQSQVMNQQEQHTRSQQVHYKFSDDEEGLNDTDDEIQGYLCVSADPRRSGSVEGGENFIITSKELRLSLQVQRKAKDQTVWMTRQLIQISSEPSSSNYNNE